MTRELSGLHLFEGVDDEQAEGELQDLADSEHQLEPSAAARPLGVEDVVVFEALAKRMNYKKDRMRTGRYEVEPGISYKALIQYLRVEGQSPVKVVLTMGRFLNDVADQATENLELVRRRWPLNLRIQLICLAWGIHRNP